VIRRRSRASAPSSPAPYAGRPSSNPAASRSRSTAPRTPTRSTRSSRRCRARHGARPRGQGESAHPRRQDQSIRRGAAQPARGGSGDRRRSRARAAREARRERPSRVAPQRERAPGAARSSGRSGLISQASPLPRAGCAFRRGAPRSTQSRFVPPDCVFWKKIGVRRAKAQFPREPCPTPPRRTIRQLGSRPRAHRVGFTFEDRVRRQKTGFREDNRAAGTRVRARLGICPPHERPGSAS
jgi:hypothetical protein